jgi:hypothetical protein
MNSIPKLPAGDPGDTRVRPEPVWLGREDQAPAATTGGATGWWLWQAIPLLLLLSGPFVLTLVIVNAPTWVRAGPVLTYLAVVPGLASVRLLRLTDRLMEILLGIAFSLALGVLLAQMMIYLRRWSPTMGLATLVLIASIAALAEVHQARPAARIAKGDPP